MAEERTQIIPEIARRMGAEKYLEIGCRYDEVFRPVQAQCPFCIGVDPRMGGNVKKTSDGFFQDLDLGVTIGAGKHIVGKDVEFDLIFIDGDHSCEQVRQDLLNSLRYLKLGGTILLHDTMPMTSGQQALNVCGTVWRVVVAVRATSILDLRTLGMDWGITAIRMQDNTDPLPVNYDLFSLDYEDFAKDRNRLLRIVEEREFIEFASGN